jgi:hypothetical protein
MNTRYFDMNKTERRNDCKLKDIVQDNDKGVGMG